ncbi:MAG: pilus assembly protein PilM [Patescibacteria group bacterium]
MAGFFSGGDFGRVFGLDIGYETLNLCEIVRHGNNVKVVGTCEYPLTERILEKDRIKDKTAAANMIKEARRKAKPHEIKATRIVSTLPETFVFSKTIQLPKMPDRELAVAIPNEAAQYLPIPISEVYIDYQILIDHPDEPITDVLVAAAPKKLVDDYVEMAKMANLELAALETKPIAIGRAVIPDKSNQAFVIVCIGSEVSRISVWDRGEIRLATTASLGKNKILETMSGTIPGLKNISEININAETKPILDSIFGEVIDEIFEAIKYHQNRDYKPGDISEIKLSGSGSEIKDIEKYFSDAIKIKAVIAKPKFKTNIEITPRFITAFGLAIRSV